MASLLSWFNQAGRAAGQAMDFVTPGDQSATWNNQAEKEAKRRQAEQARQAAARNVQSSQIYQRNQGRINQSLNQGRSFEDISNDTGLGVNEIRQVVDVTRPGYGVKPISLASVPQAVGAIGKGFVDTATVIPRKIGATLGAQNGDTEQAMQSLDAAYKQGAISQDRYQQEAQRLMGDVIGKKVVSDQNGVRVQNQNPLDFAKDFTNAGIDTANTVVPFAKGASVALNGASMFTRNGLKPVLTDAGKQLFKESTAWNAVSNAQSAMNGQLTPETILMNTAMNYALPVAGEVAVRGGKAGLKAMDPSANRPYRKVTDAEWNAAVNVRRQQSGWGNDVSDEDYRLALQFGKKVGAKDESGFDDALGQLRTWESRQQAKEGGFISGQSAKGFKQAEKDGLVFEGVDGKPRFEVDDSGASTDGTKKAIVELLRNNPKGASELADARNYTIDNNGNVFRNAELGTDLAVDKDTARKILSRYEFSKPSDLEETLSAKQAFDLDVSRGTKPNEAYQKIRGSYGEKYADFVETLNGYISDNKTSIKGKSGSAKTLRDVLDHPELYKNYPELKNFQVRIKDDYSPGTAHYDRRDKSITISPDADTKTILHEVQHVVQDTEGFARGGSPKSIEDSLTAVEVKELRNLASKADENLNGLPPKQQIRLDYLLDKGNETSIQDYKRLAGEAEARAVESRINMKPEERYTSSLSPEAQAAARVAGLPDKKTSTFYDSLDVPKEDLIVRGGDGKANNIPSNFKKIYHGTDKLFDEFDVEKSADGSIWFTDNADVIKKGEAGAAGQGHIIERYIDENNLKLGDWDVQDRLTDMEMIQQGYDGLKLVSEGETTYRLFDPKKVKKAQDFGNNVAMSIEAPKPSKRIKQAEDDYIAEKISGDELEAIKEAEAKIETATPRGTTPRPEAENTPPISNKKPSTSKLNTERIALDDEAKTRLNKDTEEVIGRLSEQEVRDAAKAAGIDFKSYGMEGTKKKIATQLNLRNEIATVEDQITKARQAGDTDLVADLMKKSAELGRTSRSQGTDVARQLAARRIIADTLATPQQKLFRLLDEAGVDPDVYTKKLADIDPTDTAAVVKAYREMVPAKFSDWLDKYRYTNMLSSPLTHIVNITSNIGGLSGIAPIQKLAEGAVDATKSALTGSARTRYASEAGAYMKGAAQSVPDAVKGFKDIMTGAKSIELPDADALKNGKLAYGGVAGAADSVLSFIPKLLEASDQLGMTLARGGERAALKTRQAKGVKIAKDIDGLVDDAAEYRVFRQKLGKEGQGIMLDAIDEIPQWIMKGRNSKNPVVSTISKFTVPFVTTPTNLFKQGIEYSPVGVLTLPGHADKTGQMAKMLMGTTVTALAAGAFASKDAITFSEPTNAKERDAFRAEGKQPYAIKIGDKWFAYSKLHPAIAFNFAVVGAVKDAQDKGAIDQPTADKIMNMAGGVLGYFRDQSYMKSVGDFTSNLEMKDGAQLEDAFASMASNYANQLSPFKSMVSWIGRQVDPTQRKTDYSASAPEQIYQNIIKDIPGLNKNVPVRENPYTGEPIKNDNPTLNAFSPVRVTNDRGFGNTTGLNVEQRQIAQTLGSDDRKIFRQQVIDDKFAKKQETEQKDAFKKGSSIMGANTSKPASTDASSDIVELNTGKFYAKVGDDYKTYDTKEQAQKAIDNKKNEKVVEQFKASTEKTKTIGDQFYFKKKDGTVGKKHVADHEEDLATVKLDNAKDAGDLTAWNQAAETKLKALEKQLERYDPEIETKEYNAVLNKIQALQKDYGKYQGYGGFTKPKSSSSKSGARRRGVFKAPTSGGIKLSGTSNSDLRKLITGSKVVRRK